jgi:hypothetical protein
MSSMPGSRIGARLSAVSMLAAAAFCAGQAGGAKTRAATLAPKLQASRKSSSDLELAGNIRGIPGDETRFLSREDLLAISQQMTIAPDDGNFHVSTTVRGVRLEDLARALGAPAGDMVIAICKDKYRGHYRQSYLAAHHPVLVLELDGKALSDLPEDREGGDPGPYLIAHASFPRTAKDPVGIDEPQIPWGVVRLDFRDEETVLDSIKPRIANLQQAIGYGIAEQNCFRCHNNGAEGGLKSGVTWTVLAALAANSPQFFTEYVRDPKSKNPKTQMAANPGYDDATMSALIAYFKGFAPAGAR